MQIIDKFYPYSKIINVFSSKAIWQGIVHAWNSLFHEIIDPIDCHMTLL
jgi:hypothetical protein